MGTRRDSSPIVRRIRAATYGLFLAENRLTARQRLGITVGIAIVAFFIGNL